MFKKIFFATCIINFNITNCSQHPDKIVYATKSISCCAVPCTIACQRDTTPSYLNSCINGIGAVINICTIQNPSHKIINTYHVNNAIYDNGLHVASIDSLSMNRSCETYIYTEENLKSAAHTTAKDLDNAINANNQCYKSLINFSNIIAMQTKNK